MRDLSPLVRLRIFVLLAIGASVKLTVLRTFTQIVVTLQYSEHFVENSDESVTLLLCLILMIGCESRNMSYINSIPQRCCNIVGQH